MNYFKRSIILLSLFLLIGCGHSINISPPLNTLDKDGIHKIDKNVGYFISKENIAKEITTPGGGDKVKYFPYKESEPALKKILSNIFDQVHRVPSVTDLQFITSNNISYIFTPEFKTDSSSESMFTWPPTKFSIIIDCKAVDKAGIVLWQTKITSEGNAEFAKFKHDFSLAAKRATKKAFTKLQDEIIESGKF
ncbi:MAG: hypothetical protein PF690_00050 [Deltaproteobacteria bacterium]|jgi:hypothetical protein|nr:hypothetical protein [Deltaproteobacteria bacterium]